MRAKTGPRKAPLSREPTTEHPPVDLGLREVSPKIVQTPDREANYIELVNKFSQLADQYRALTEEYTDLVRRYQELVEKYAKLVPKKPASGIT